MAQAQTVYYDPASASLQAEISSWGDKYSELLTTVTPASGASAFAYTTPALNSPLFAPIRAATKTIAEAIATGSCGEGGAAVGNPYQPSVKVLDWLTETKISASLTEDPEKLMALINAVLNDPEATALVDQEDLVTFGITAPMEMGDIQPKVLANVPPSVSNWLGELGVNSGVAATSIDYSDDARRRLLGQPRGIDELEATLNGWAQQEQHDLTTYQAEALFGTYGSLPMLVGVFSDNGTNGFVLIDAMTGVMDGPFEAHTAIDPRPLLALHSEYISGTGIRVIDSKTGCDMPVAIGWHPAPPAGPYAPRPIPNPNVPTTSPRYLPGWPTQPTCITITSPPTCSCTWTEQDLCTTVPASACTPPGYRVKITCSCPVSTCTTTAVPPFPPCPGAGRGPPLPPGCTATYWY